jgi:hypothetical protein
MNICWLNGCYMILEGIDCLDLTIGDPKQGRRELVPQGAQEVARSQEGREPLAKRPTSSMFCSVLGAA